MQREAGIDEETIFATGVAVGAWSCIAASVRGVGHIKVGLPCQDAHAWRLLAPDVIGVAVADGAGSAQLSEIGARIAADSALNAIQTSLNSKGLRDDDSWLDLLRSAMLCALSSVEAEAAQRNVEAKELAATLILVVATPDILCALQIGDGAVVQRLRVQDNEPEALAAITSPGHGEYINETTFLTSIEAIDTAQSVVQHGETAGFAIFTDGLQEIALTSPGYSAHGPFFQPLFRFAETATDHFQAEAELAAFLQSPRFAERTDDDLTLVLATLSR